VYVLRLPPAAWKVDGGDRAEPFGEVRRFEGHTHYVVGVAFSPDGKRAFSTSFDKTVRVWDVATGAELGKFLGHEDTTWGLAVTFSHEGRLVASGAGGDRTVRLWDAASGKPLAVLDAHEGDVRRAVFSPKDKYLLTAGEDGLRLWDVATRRAVGEFFGHTAKA